jgi:hypothetical protein
MTPYNSNSLVNCQSFHEVAIASLDGASCTEGVNDFPLGRFDHCYEKHINAGFSNSSAGLFVPLSSSIRAPFAALAALLCSIGQIFLFACVR